MAYCRWSDCDVYVYQSERGWETHVAANKFADGPIDLPHAGENFVDETPGKCATRLFYLRKIGYMVPQYAIDELHAEQDEMDISTIGEGL